MAGKASEKTEQSDLFARVYSDIPIRDQRDTMERPFFSLAKKPRMKAIEYHVGNTKVRVSPNSEHGIATIWDADVLIWAASQLTERLDKGEKNPDRTLTFNPYNLLKGIRRGTSGTEYMRLRAALQRLAATYVETSIRRNDQTRGNGGFHWLESWDEETDAEGNVKGMTITLPSWLYKGIVRQGGVLTIHEDYFKLKGGIERWLYRVARKHAGHQEDGWSFTLRQLHEKSGSAARFNDFAVDIRELAERNTLPEYALTLRQEEGQEVLHFQPRHLLDITDPQFQPQRPARGRLLPGAGGFL